MFWLLQLFISFRFFFFLTWQVNSLFQVWWQTRIIIKSRLHQIENCIVKDYSTPMLINSQKHTLKQLLKSIHVKDSLTLTHNRTYITLFEWLELIIFNLKNHNFCAKIVYIRLCIRVCKYTTSYYLVGFSLKVVINDKIWLIKLHENHVGFSKKKKKKESCRLCVHLATE